MADLGFWQSRQMALETMRMGRGELNYDIVQRWLRDQPPGVLRQVLDHCKERLSKDFGGTENKTAFQVGPRSSPGWLWHCAVCSTNGCCSRLNN